MYDSNLYRRPHAMQWPSFASQTQPTPDLSGHGRHYPELERFTVVR